jgi:hypothetical protein
MDDFRDEAGLWADGPKARARTADAVRDPAPRKMDTVSARSALIACFSRYGPLAALSAWMIAVAWMAGSHFDGRARTAVRQDSVQGAEVGRVAQKAGEDAHPQKACVDATRTAAIPEASAKVERPPPKSADRTSKAGERLDRIGLEIVALLADSPADPSSAPAPIARRPARSARHDAFDPSLNPAAAGAPRPLGAVAPTTTASNASRSALGL